MRIAVTGADGFIGRAFTKRLCETGLGDGLRLVDIAFKSAGSGVRGAETVALDLTRPDSAARAIDGIDCLIHLAALPGAAAQADPRRSRTVNLDATLALMEAMDGRRFIYASSIAALGSNLPHPVNDDTAPIPVGPYGTHKRMVELAFADMVDRKALSGLAMRLPGIVARPSSTTGFGSAFLSEIFHAANEGRAYRIPVSPKAASWLMSVSRCAENLVEAALSKETTAQAVTLPAVRASMAELVAELARNAGQACFTHDPDAAIERAFGSYPVLHATRAEALGFRSDGSIASLVSHVLRAC